MPRDTPKACACQTPQGAIRRDRTGRQHCLQRCRWSVEVERMVESSRQLIETADVDTVYSVHLTEDDRHSSQVACAWPVM